MKISELSKKTQTIINNYGNWARQDIEHICEHQKNEKAFLKQLDYWLINVIIDAETLREELA